MHDKRRSFYVRIEEMRLRPNIPAGMNPFVLMGLVTLLRSTDQDHDPVLVRRHKDGKSWLLLDGRHRFLASIIAGRCDVLAVEECKDN